MTGKPADDFTIWRMEMLLAKSSIGHRDPRTVDPEEQALVEEIVQRASRAAERTEEQK